MDKYRLRAFVSLVAAICLGAGLTIVIRSMKNGLPLNEDPHALLRLPVRQQEYWKDHFARPLTERVGIPPEDVLSYLRADNVKQGFSEIPTAIDSPESVQTLREAVTSLPEPVRKALEKKLAAIFIVNNLGGSAVTNSIYADGPESPVVGAFIAFDVSALNKTANEWATWKDQSPFKSGDFSVRTIIAEKKDNNRLGAYQFILLHELAHVLAAGDKIHPNWDLPPDDVEQYPFSAISWITKGGSFERDDRYGALVLPPIPFYRDESERLPASDVVPIYEALEQSPFVTLYATTSPYDDFADLFATYVHSQILGKPYFVEILEGKKVVKKFQLCYSEPRCKQKEDFIKAYYESLSK